MNRIFLITFLASLGALTVSCSSGSDPGTTPGGSTENCDNDLDDDGDGDIDCDDADCSTAAVCASVQEICNNDLDDDDDGASDCDDSDCDDHANCSGEDEEICDNEIDDDGDTDIDCDDSDCDGETACSSEDEEICDNELDDDGDTDIDCEDSDCDEESVCNGEDEEICDNDLDDDGDEDIDCADADCDEDSECIAEICDNDLDDDGDTDFDCDDSECAEDSECIAEICDNDLDDDGDTDFDCDDSECVDDAACIVEDCDTPGDEDLNDLADCEDPACAEEIDCLCGNGDVDIVVEEDYTEECDQGLANNDAAPNTCREDCMFPICGDGVVDFANPDPEAEVANESCDGGDNCSELCAYDDPTAACGDLEVVEVDDDYRVDDEDDHYFINGEITGGASEVEPGMECGEDLPDSGDEEIYIFTPTTTGLYFATTDFFGTEVDTLLYKRGPACLSGGSVCNDDSDETTLGSTIFFDGYADQPVYLTVDSFAGDFGAIELEIAPATEVGDTEECAPPFVVCEEGLECLMADGGQVCGNAVAPTLTEVSMLQVLEGVDIVLIFRAQGIDPNEDIDGFQGALLGTSPTTMEPLSEIALDFDLSTIVYGVDGSFEATTRLNADDLVAEGYNTVEGLVYDNTDLESDIVSGLIAAQEIVGLGSECDGLATICTEGNACLDNPDGEGRICTEDEGALPVITTLEAFWHVPDELEIVATGTDADGDVTGLQIYWYDSDGVLAEPVDGQLVDFNNNLFGMTAWEGHLTLFFDNPADAALAYGSIGGLAVDDGGNLSLDELNALLPFPTVSGLDEPCDADGASYLCASPFLCDNYVGELGTCRNPELQVHGCGFGTYEDGSIYLEVLYETAAEIDLNESARFFWIDVHRGDQMRISTISGSGYYLTYDDNDSRSLVGVGLGILRLGLGDGTLFDAADTHVYCHIANYYFGGSNHARGSLVPEVGIGESCDLEDFTNLCRTGLACVEDGDGGTNCSRGEAPTAFVDPDDSDYVVRVSQTSVLIDLDITNPDGDGVFYRQSWLDSDLNNLISPVSTPNSFGEIDPTTTSFTGAIDTSLPAALDEVWDDIEYISLEVYDTSNMSDLVIVPINIAAGEVCVVDGIPCRDSLECDPAAGDDPICLPSAGAACLPEGSAQRCATGLECIEDICQVTE